MTQALVVVSGLFVLVYVPVAVLAWRRPLLARFAWRESTRRRGQFALLVVGLLAGSASITASMVAADSGTQSLAFLYDQRLASVDMTVTAVGGRSFPLEVAQRLASDPGLSRYVDGVQAGLELPASVGDLDQRLGRSDVLMVGFDPASQSRFGAYTLSNGRHTFGGDLAPGDVLLSAALASDINARAGDRLHISSGSTAAAGDLRVSGIAIASGPGAYASRLAVFVPLATAQMIASDSGINVIRIAARGGTRSDLGPARRAAAPLTLALAQIPGGASLSVNHVRVDAARQLENAAAWDLGTMLGFSGLVVLAAIALILNLILALAEERRPRLAILRALGLSRSGLIALSVLEGAIYSLAAATAGVAVGVAAGLYLGGALWQTALIDPGDKDFLGLPLQFTVKPGTLALAFAAGALITLGTFAAAAYRTSRLAIASAVRDLPEPALPVRDRRLRTAVLVGLALLGAVMLIPAYGGARLAGGVALITSTTALARGRLSDRARATLAGLLLFAWAGIMAAGNTNWTDIGNLLTVFSGVAIAAIGLSLAAAANLRLIEASLGVLGNGFGLVQATLRPPLAYLSRRPVRTGLATSAFAMVLVMVTVIAVYVAGLNRNYARDAAGFDIQVVTAGASPIQLPSDVEPQITRQITLPMRLYQGPVQATGFFAENGTLESVMFYVLPDQPIDAEPAYLASKERRFRINEAAWQAVRSEPGSVVIMGGSGVSPGDSIALEGIDGPIQLRVAGIEAGSVIEGVIASPATLARIDTRPAGSTLLLKTVPRTDPHALARQIERSLFSQGVQATAIHDILDQDYESTVQYATEYDVLLHMGLLVGVLALTMIGIRAAVERRRAIGILRSLGYQPPRVLAGLLVEATLTATIGVATGIGAGLLGAYFLIASNVQPGATFGIDLERLGLALVIVYATVLVVTGPLASRAARMAPTEAIRLTG
jgi:ABC-type lipoprotein release transport system permease subunit